MKMNKDRIAFLFTLLIPLEFFANMKQALPEQVTDDSWVNNIESSETPFIGGETTRDINIPKTPFNQSWVFRPYYTKDSYKYRVFEDKNLLQIKEKKGYFIFEGYRYITKGPLNTFWGINAGIGNVRAQSTQKDFLLWMIPLGVPLGLEFPLKWFKTTVLIGPSALLAVQHQTNKNLTGSDKSDQEKQKYGLGYFAEGRISMNIGDIMQERMIRFFSQYKISNIYLDFIIRNQRYSSSFTDSKEDFIESTGLSYGVGLSFEYLMADNTKASSVPFAGSGVLGDAPSQGTIHFKNEGLDSQLHRIPSVTENSQYLEADDAQRFQEISQNSSKGFRLYYINDSYKYSSRKDNFNKIFEDKYLFKGKDRKGYFMLESYRYMTKGRYNTFWGINAGVGYNRNYGLFVDGKRLEKRFLMWTIPVGISLGLEIPMQWFKTTILMGPSALGVIQHRGDKEQGHQDKEKRQYGLGYFAEGKISLNLGNIMKKRLVRLFFQHKLTNLYLDFIARNQRYSRFRDKTFGVSGISYGAGLTFEYL